MSCTTFAAGFVEGTEHDRQGSSRVAAVGGEQTPSTTNKHATTKTATTTPVGAPSTSPATAVAPPPGGKKEVKTKVMIQGNEKMTRTTTIITDADGNRKTYTETRIERSSS